MGTIHGAKGALSHDEFCSLEKGKKAAIANFIDASRGGAETVPCDGKMRHWPIVS